MKIINKLYVLSGWILGSFFLLFSIASMCLGDYHLGIGFAALAIIVLPILALPDWFRLIVLILGTLVL